MDFFSAVADPSQPIIHNDRPLDSANDPFAEAIASRFGSSALLTTRLTPVTLAPPFRLQAPPMANLSATPPSIPRPSSSMSQNSSQLAIHFTTITVGALGPWTGDPTALILDIRPHAAYSTARIPRAVSLSVPSTLLKRPLFSLSRLADMLPSANARARFSSWRSASRILVYDADSLSILESSNIYGLLRKLKNDGFQGDLAWLKGGFQAVWRESRDTIDTHPPTPDAENDDDDDDDEDGKSFSSSTPNVLRTRHLPMSAFSFSSTTVSNSSSLNLTNPKRGSSSRGSIFPKLSTPSQNQSQPAYNPFFDAVRQNLELSQGITERIPLCLPRRVRRRIHELPFNWLREIARRAAKSGPRPRSAIDSSSTSEESEDDESIAYTDVEEGKEVLAMQFYKVELAEQRRLMGVMEYHTKETAIVTTDMNSAPASSVFPYSITAGVEKGAKNRYRNIWPFEHARVKLHQTQDTDDDYVNASYVQPIATNKRYIATQGPLPATFTDFWTLCWEQNVHVIVMLTREVEDSRAKCGSYWTDTVFGPLRLRQISTTDPSFSSEEPRPSCPGPGSPRQCSSSPSTRIPQQSSSLSPHHTCKDDIVRRVFELTHTRYPDIPPRRIIQLQYLGWPDMNVPDDPRSLLELVKEVDAAVKETENTQEIELTASTTTITELLAPAPIAGIDKSTGIVKQTMGRNRPVLLHCSAGVGRTGGFIIVDAVLDAIRREFKKWEIGDEDAMEVDVPSAVPTATASKATGNDSEHDLNMEAASIAINTENTSRVPSPSDGLLVYAPVVPTPSSDGTEPEASGSDKEASTNESVLCADDTTLGAPVTHQQSRIFQSERNIYLPSQVLLPTLPSDESNSSKHSFFNPSSSSGNVLADQSPSFYLPRSSSSATSMSADNSAQSSPRKLALRPDLDTSGISVPQLAGSILAKSVSQPHMSPGACSEYNVETYSGLKASLDGTEILPQSLAPREVATHTQKRLSPPLASLPFLSQEPTRMSLHPSLLGPPSHSGGVSSDEPPSRSMSPSADEGTVASQVSSYHSYLKNHHYRPIHPESVVANRNGPDKEKSLRSTSVSAMIAERSSSPANLQAASYQSGSGLVSVAKCKKPRMLHEVTAPIELSSLEEPICEVVQDMREQRMSLCQSLRQYIYVHAVILEGALMIVDEERELMRKKKQSVVQSEESETEARRGWKAGNTRMTPTSVGASDSIDCSSEGSGNEQYSLGFSKMLVENKNDDFIVGSSLAADIESVDESAMDVYYSPMPKNPPGHGFTSAFTSPQRPRHLGRGTGIGKRGRSPSDCFRDGAVSLSLDDDSEMLRKLNGKRKQPIGETDKAARRKRAQNESSSRERGRESGLERGLRNSSHSRSRDSPLDLLTSGVVR